MKNDELKLMNHDMYKSKSEHLEKTIKKLLRAIPSEDLKDELKRRKLISFNWETNKWEERKS